MSTNGTNKTIFTCPHCNQRFEVIPPKPDEPLNTLRTSVIVAPHEKPFRCKNAKCAKPFVFTVKEAQLSWTIIPISEEAAASVSDSNIITPPLGLSLVH